MALTVALTGIAAVAINGLFEVGIRGLHLVRASQPPSPCADCRHGTPFPRRPFVSVHVATYNEPPDLVVATLTSLAKSDFADFEIIALDNNTADPRIWRPVETAARALGPQFRFFHLDDVQGAKAGALNEALARTDARATHVAIVDADYQADSGFLADAMAALRMSGVDYVQFPQAYRGVSRHAVGVERELGDYFTGFGRGGDCSGPMLPTGTLSVFDIRALRAIGGWSAAFITEDAEIGVRLQAAGYRGQWIARERGRGLLPLDFRGLRVQRARWVAGNVQVLRRVLTDPRLLRSRAHLPDLVLQLTAWLSLWGLPAAVLPTGLLPRFAGRDLLTGLAALTICASLLLTAARMATMRRTGAGKAAYGAALMVKLALTWTSVGAWLPALLRTPLPFRRTRKRRGGDAPDREWPLALVSAAYAVLALFYAARLHPLEMFACAVLAAVWPCARFVDRALRASARLNPELA